MAYSVITTHRFEKSVKRCIKRGLPMDKLREVILLLAENGALPATYKPHRLVGDYAGCWECHIQPDWLLVWQQRDEELVLLLIDTGSHSDLF